ncbi:MAG: hypothetical protein KGL45_02560 [Gammaproteobacteria bacterium]|nr:hypothetical protein [Gammaproteobacteria bacterium]
MSTPLLDTQLALSYVSDCDDSIDILGWAAETVKLGYLSGRASFRGE